MLRLIHQQTVTGAILVDDIDDGLPNKQIKRLGSTADPDAYKRDGYANEPKQPCYVPRVNPNNTAQAGYIDLEETQRVTHSAFNGKIAGLQTAGLVSVVSLVAADLNAPAISGYTVSSPASGDVTLAGTAFLSVLPDVTSVAFAGAGVGSVTLTQAQIIAVAPGAVSNTAIIVDATLIPSLSAGDTITVNADAQDSNTVTIAPVISAVTLDSPAAGDVTIDGVSLESVAPLETSVRLFGAGVGDVTLTKTQILAAAPGAVSDTQIIIDSTLIAGLASADDIIVTAGAQASNTFAVP